MAIDDALANPQTPDPPPVTNAIVTTEAFSVKQGRMAYPVPANLIVGTVVLPARNTSFKPPPKHRLMPLGSYKIGDTVPILLSPKDSP